jgi:hypothetical protein
MFNSVTSSHVATPCNQENAECATQFLPRIVSRKGYAALATTGARLGTEA